MDWAIGESPSSDRGGGGNIEWPTTRCSRTRVSGLTPRTGAALFALLALGVLLGAPPLSSAPHGAVAPIRLVPSVRRQSDARAAFEQRARSARAACKAPLGRARSARAARATSERRPSGDRKAPVRDSIGRPRAQIGYAFRTSSSEHSKNGIRKNNPEVRRRGAETLAGIGPPDHRSSGRPCATLGRPPAEDARSRPPETKTQVWRIAGLRATSGSARRSCPV